MSTHPILLLLLLACAGMPGCNRVEVDAPDDSYSDPKLFAQKMDEWASEALTQTRHEPASHWLEQPQNKLAEGDPQAIAMLVEDLYRAGAPAIWFTGIEARDGTNVAAAVAVEMPSEAAARQALLQREAAFFGYEAPNPDVGQKYLGFAFE